jgi:hypothetical protein
VLSAFITIASAAPSGLFAARVAYSANPSYYESYAVPYASKTITYASQPIVTGYSSSILKPNLAFAPEVKAYHDLESIVVDTPTVAQIGSVHTSVPTAVSHQSSTIVHSKADIVEPILAPAITKSIVSTPVTKYIASPVAQGYYQPAAYASSPYAAQYYTAPAVNYASYSQW